MAQAWVLIEFTDATGKHEVGKKIDLPRNTDEEKHSYQTLLDNGIVSDREPPSTDEGSSRRRRDRSESG